MRPRKVDRDEFAELAAAGKTNPELQAHFGISEATASRMRKLTDTSTAVRITPEAQAERLKQAARLLEDGASQHEVQRTTGLARETIRKHFPGQGWTHVEGGKFRVLTKGVW